MGEYFRLVMAEFLKQKRSFLWPVVLATPLLGAFLSFCNLFLRYDYLMGLEANQGLTPWQVLLFQHHFLWAFLLPLVATITASQVHHLEYRSRGWKQVLALPVSRAKVYLAKWSAVFLLNILLIVGNSICLLLIGKALGFPETLDVCWQAIRPTKYWPSPASGLQCWLNSSSSNANVPWPLACWCCLPCPVGGWLNLFPTPFYTLPEPTTQRHCPVLRPVLSCFSGFGQCFPVEGNC